MMGWLGAPSAVRVKRGANFLNGSSRYCSQRPSGSMVCRSLSRTRNPCFIEASSESRVSALGLAGHHALQAEGHEQAQETEENDIHGEPPHRRHEVGPAEAEHEYAEGHGEKSGGYEKPPAPGNPEGESPSQLEDTREDGPPCHEEEDGATGAGVQIADEDEPRDGRDHLHHALERHEAAGQRPHQRPRRRGETEEAIEKNESGIELHDEDGRDAGKQGGEDDHEERRQSEEQGEEGAKSQNEPAGENVGGHYPIPMGRIPGIVRVLWTRGQASCALHGCVQMCQNPRDSGSRSEWNTRARPHPWSRGGFAWPRRYARRCF